MANISHTYDASCLLHTDSNLFTRRASSISIGPPPIKAHYFYCSSLPIDDPLLPIPPPSSSATKPARIPPRPFSVHDNRALEEAWLRIHKPFRSIDSPKKPLEDFPWRETPTKDSESKFHDTVNKIFKGAQERHPSRRSIHQAEEASKASSSGPSTTAESWAEPVQLISSRHASIGDIDPLAQLSPRHSRFTEHTDAQTHVPNEPERAPLSQISPVTAKEIGDGEVNAGLRLGRRRSRSPFRRKTGDELEPHDSKNAAATDGQGTSSPTSRAAHHEPELKELGSSPTERDTTGTPFLRIPSRLSRSRSQSHRRTPSIEIEPVAGLDGSRDGTPGSPPRATLQRLPRSNHLRRDASASVDYAASKKVQLAKVPVGVSRLHVVEMPELKMGPIYWDPVHDVSSVVRGTWFYKETMFPVEADFANQLEEGYEYIKPWTPTYQDELNSCLEIGPEAELKVAHKIWPSDEPKEDPQRPIATTDKHGFLAVPGDVEPEPEPEDARQTSAIKAAGKPENRAAGVLDGFSSPVRLFAKSSIIFINAYEGQILNPSQLPSAARGRKPLAKIRKGQPVGVTVIRGFDFKAWEKKYSQKRGSTKQARDGLHGMRTTTTATNGRKKSCAACLSADETPPVTDLVLVVHGIGQKLSERVESFHFTHAINAFRRSMNIELQSEVVKPWLRPELGSIMVLPVNWRSKMTLDNGDAAEAVQGDDDPSENQYALKDITAESLPAVRNLISDVMLDIPYYLSHHKPKMIEAVIQEANRIYRLWCLNNPGFHESGRVHLIAHSLGSVMALDILSKQPTTLPKELDLKSTIPRTDILEFDTKSLFFCGSPAGFFLLLNRATILPRRGREKPGAELEDMTSKDVSGETGTYGCLAVDNLYNVLHQNDPVAYRVNACVDLDYSDSLQQAYVPSAASSWSQYFGAMFKGRPVTPAKSLASIPPRPTIAKLPSTVEMETHNFTREEIAEKRMFLLNDNGQIDYTLKSGGGPLEIQYFNMLSAHSSYWILQDFVRFLVVEIGRKPGKSETVSSFKAVKRAWGKK